MTNLVLAESRKRRSDIIFWKRKGEGAETRSEKGVEGGRKNSREKCSTERYRRGRPSYNPGLRAGPRIELILTEKRVRGQNCGGIISSISQKLIMMKFSSSGKKFSVPKFAVAIRIGQEVGSVKDCGGGFGKRMSKKKKGLTSTEGNPTLCSSVRGTEKSPLPMEKRGE